MNAQTLLNLANLEKRDRYLRTQDTETVTRGQKSNVLGVYLGFDSELGVARVQIPSTGQTLEAKVLTNGHIGVGTRVMVKVDGATAFINEMPRR